MEEFRLSDIFLVIKKNVSIIIKTLGVFLLIGLINFFFTPKEYISSSKLLPVVEDSGKISGGLGSLAGLAGISLNNSTSGSIPPNLYPDVVNSAPFGLYLAKQTFYFEGLADSLSLENYFVYHQEVGFLKKITNLPKTFINLFKSSNSNKTPRESPKNNTLENGSFDSAPALTNTENSAISQIRSRVTAELDPVTGIVTIQVKMQDAKVSAELVQLTNNYLSQYLTDYKSSADKRNLEFIQNQFEDAKQNYLEAQSALASFKDRNMNVISSTVMVREEQLRNEAAIYFNVYNNLAQEVEQAKIRTQRSTPVFNVLEPGYVPLKESSPKLFLTLIVFGFLGVIASLSYILITKKVTVDNG